MLSKEAAQVPSRQLLGLQANEAIPPYAGALPGRRLRVSLATLSIHIHNYTHVYMYMVDVDVYVYAYVKVYACMYIYVYLVEDRRPICIYSLI